MSDNQDTNHRPTEGTLLRSCSSLPFQYSHSLRPRGSPYLRMINKLKETQAGQLACGHQDTIWTWDHVKKELFQCEITGEQHWDNSLENAQGICFKCNSARGKNRQPTRATGERDFKASAHAPRFEDTYSNHKAFTDQPDYREYCFKAVLTKEDIPFEVLNRSACEFVKVSIKTGEKWFQRLLPNEGPFEDLAKTANKVRFYKPVYKFLNHLELTEIFPCHTRITQSQKDFLISVGEERMRAHDELEARARMPIK